MNASGRSTRRAPLAAASRMILYALSVPAARSNRTGAAWATATRAVRDSLIDRDSVDDARRPGMRVRHQDAQVRQLRAGDQPADARRGQVIARDDQFGQGQRPAAGGQPKDPVVAEPGATDVERFES